VFSRRRTASISEERPEKRPSGRQERGVDWAAVFQAETFKGHRCLIALTFMPMRKVHPKYWVSHIHTLYLSLPLSIFSFCISLCMYSTHRGLCRIVSNIHTSYYSRAFGRQHMRPLAQLTAHMRWPRLFFTCRVLKGGWKTAASFFKLTPALVCRFWFCNWKPCVQWGYFMHPCYSWGK
jgi:hypothetical protein